MSDFQYDNVETFSGSSEPAGAPLAFEPIQFQQSSVRLKPKPAPGTIHILGAEARDLWDCHARLDELGAGLEGADCVEVRRRMDMVSERIAAIEAQASFLRATALADLMFQIALVYDRVSDLCDKLKDEHDGILAERGVTRILSSMLTFLMQETGLTLHDVGAKPYMAEAFKMASHELAALDQRIFGSDFVGAVDDDREAA